MILKNTTIQKFFQIVKDSSFVCFGASKMPQELCEWYTEFEFQKKIRFIADNDKTKWHTDKEIQGYNIPVISPAEFVENTNENEVILITSRYYYDIIEQLQSIKKLERNVCYVFPLMELEHSRFEVTKRTSQMIIPKKIHYCWFGGGAKPKLNQACIDSWKKYCPDYEIIEWNPQNCDMEINSYVSEAYHKCKQWGAVSDYFSVKILYEHGGIYLDTDVQLLKNIDIFLCNLAFASFDSTNGMINFGSGAGTVPGNMLFKEIQNEYEDLHFLNPDGSRNDAANYIYQTRIIRKYGLRLDNSKQYLDNISIYPSECFCPYDLRSGKTNMTSNTYGIHQFDGSWWDAERKKVYSKQQQYSMSILRRIEENE